MGYRASARVIYFLQQSNLRVDGHREAMESTTPVSLTDPSLEM